MADLELDLLDQALATLHRRGGLRPPQRDALAALDLAFKQAAVTLDASPEDVSTAFELQAGFARSETVLAECDFALATGVGKSRLAGAVIEWMVLAGLSKTFLVLSHRELLNRRWRWALDSSNPKTIVPLIANRPDYVVADCASSFDAHSADNSVVVISQTVQAVSNQRSLWWQDSVSGLDLRDWLRERNDLVVIFDEAHHLHGDSSTSGWRAALNDLKAKLLLGLTATPRGNRHVLFEYPLSRLLQEGKYSKHVDFLVDTMPSLVRESDYDSTALEIGLQLLDAKKAYVASLPEEHPLAWWSPALFIPVSGIQEVENVKQSLVRDFNVSPERILAIASGITSDVDLEKILQFDERENVITDIVIAAFMLDEGWDVTRISVIVPFRALNSISNAKQILGRGLRLPAGRRLHDSKLDTLEVVIVGQSSLFEIKREVAIAFGEGAVNVLETANRAGTRQTEVFIDREEGSSSQRFIVQTERTRPIDLYLPLLIPKTLYRGVPERWSTESVNLNLSRVAADSGELSVASDVVVKRQIVDIAVRVAERVDYASPKVVLDVLSSWASATGRVLPDAMSISAVEAVMREALDASWFDWQDSGQRVSVTPAVTKTSSDVDPQTAVSIDQPWGGKKWWEGWVRSMYSLTRFDTLPEFKAAHLLDSASGVDWWVRNDPKLLRVSLPSFRFSPDFFVRVGDCIVLLEIKGDNQLEGFLSRGLVKTMESWVANMQVASGFPIRFEIVKSSEVESGLLPRLTAR